MDQEPWCEGFGVEIDRRIQVVPESFAGGTKSIATFGISDVRALHHIAK